MIKLYFNKYVYTVKRGRRKEEGRDEIPDIYNTMSTFGNSLARGRDF